MPGHDTAGDAAVYDVAIVGFGPSGAVAAGLLGGYGIKTWACDKSTEVYDKPRAFALDHEVMRVFQQLGVHDEVLKHAEPFTPSEFYGVDGQMIKRFSTVEAPYPLAFPPSLVFNQPAAERILRDHVASLDSVDVELGCEVTALAQTDDMVSLQVTTADGSVREVRARWVIACDGASSAVRGLAGIGLEDLGFDQPWLVVDVRVNEDGAARLPRVSMQFCEPARPTTYLVGPGNHRRWEISLNPGEDPAQVATPEGTWKLLSRWITPDHATLWRQASYRFHALVADRWRAGRVFVAGDAAHQQPPFLGQGMCQGVRDVTNLAWKLRAVLQQGAHDSLLDTYGQERKAHVRALTTRIKNIGLLIGERDTAKARERDAKLLAECGGVVKSIPRQDVQPALDQGLLNAPAAPPVGTLFPQPWVSTPSGQQRLDEVAGRGWRIALDASAASALRDVARDFAGSRGLAAGVSVIDFGNGAAEADGITAAWFSRHACAAAIVRPDHYVYGIASTAGQLSDQLQALQQKIKSGDNHDTPEPALQL